MSRPPGAASGDPVTAARNRPLPSSSRRSLRSPESSSVPTAALPSLLLITDRFGAGERGVPSVVAAAVEGGARWVLLRDRDLPAAERAALAHELAAIVGEVGGTLTVAGPSGHLSATEPFPAERPALVGRSCHSPAELERAAGEGCDYAVISPVFETASKPGHGPALGLGRLAGWCSATPLPVYALGGIDARRAQPCREAGAAGVAVMGAVMRAPEPDRVVRDLLEAVSMAGPA
jgi:thiamine monophosphate synthase